MSWAGFLVLGFVGLVLAIFLWTAASSRSLRGQSVEALHPALPGLASQGARAVIYCYTEHCPPCRKMGPEIDALQRRHPNVFKLDILSHPRESRQIGVRATPTTLLIEDGKIHKALLGAGALGAVRVFLGER